MTMNDKGDQFIEEMLGGDKIPEIYARTFIDQEKICLTNDFKQTPTTITNRRLVSTIPVTKAVVPYDVNVFDECSGAKKLEDFYTELSNVELSKKGLDPQSDFDHCCTCENGCGGDCPCVEANSKIYGDNYAFYTNGKIVLHGEANPYFSSQFIITCGKQCACYEQTENHPRCLYNIDLFSPSIKFEVFCNNTDMGYCIRTVQDIKKGGEILGELTGEILPNDHPDLIDNSQYAMTLFDSDKLEAVSFVAKIRKLEKFKKISAKTMKKSIGNGYFIQTARKSSLLRLTSHSCLPSSGFIIIIANNFHPSRRRIFVTSLHPIKAGSEINISYGSSYIHDHFEKCLCGASNCVKKGPTNTPKPVSSVAEPFQKIVSLCHRYLKSRIKEVYPNFKDAKDEETMEPEIKRKRLSNQLNNGE